MACNDRQLTEAQRQAGYQQQRTGVVRAVRPFSGSPTVENLVDYINRELGPAVRASRDAVNECFLQVTDNAPSANPLAFYFATSVAAADPTVGRIRLNQATQNTATVMRVSQSNARLVDVQPWLDVMAGGPTTPLGVVTLVDAINPARFIRFDLNTMTDQGAYWDLGITVIESSDASPFVEDEAVVVGFISGVSAAGSTIPVGALSPIARDTFIGNITTGTAAPSAVPLASVDSTSITYDGTAHEFQRAAITGAIAVAANANASLFAGIRDNGLAEIDRTNLNFLSTTSIVSLVTDDAGGDELEITLQRAALTGDVTATQNSNATTIANDAVTNAKLANMAAGTQKGRQIDSGAAGDPVDLTGAEQGENIRFATRQDTALTGTQNNFALSDDTTELQATGATVTFTGFARNSVAAAGKPFLLRASNTTTITLAHNTTSSATQQIACPNSVDFVMPPRSVVWLYESDDKWRVVSLPSAGRLIAFTEYTSGSGTHTFDPATTFVVRDLVGAGGPGGSILNVAGSDAGASGGGGGGRYARAEGAPGGATEAYSVGVGGTAAAGVAGSDGGNSTMGAFSADGGVAAPLCTTTLVNGISDGGGNTGGTKGSPGTPGWWDAFAVGTSRTVPGIGGSSVFGGGGWRESAIGAGSANGVAGGGPGTGGSGARTQATAGNNSGGPGKDGYIAVWEYS